MFRKVSENLSPRFYWSYVTKATGLDGLFLRRVSQGNLGWKLDVRLPVSITPEQLASSSERLAVYFSAARVRIYSREDNLSLAEIYVDYRLQPPAQVYPDRHIYIWTPLPAASRVPLFYTDEGEKVSLSLHGSSALLAGNPGSGKSTAIRVILNSLAQQRNTALFGIDPKLVELASWRSRFTKLIRGDDPDELKDFLEFLLRIIQDRAQHMSREGIVNLPPSREFPSIVLVVDEWAEMAATGNRTQRQEIADLLRRYISLGRAVGCSAILATQRPTGDTIDPGTRSLLAHRLAFRCGDKWQAEAILGMGHHEPTKISLETPGKAFYSDGSSVIGVKVYSFPEDRIDPCPVLRIELDDLAPHPPRVLLDTRGHSATLEN